MCFFHFSVKVNARHADYMKLLFRITGTEIHCQQAQMFQVLTQQGIFSRWSAWASRYSLSERGISDRQSEPTTKGKRKNNWKWIPTNTNSLLLNCFGLAWSIAKKRAWSGKAWKRREGRRGAPPQQSWIMGSLFDVGACDFFLSGKWLQDIS